MNKVILYGNLGKDPEIKIFGTTTVATFSLATTRSFKDKEGNKVTDWHRVKAFGKTAEICKYLNKGSKVIIEGEIQYSSYEKDGNTIYSTDIVVSSLTFLDKKQDTSSTENFKSSTNDFKYEDIGKDDLPF